MVVGGFDFDRDCLGVTVKTKTPYHDHLNPYLLPSLFFAYMPFVFRPLICLYIFIFFLYFIYFFNF